MIGPEYNGPFTAYDIQTGEVRGTGQGIPDTTGLAEVGVAVLLGVVLDTDTQWLDVSQDPPAAAERPPRDPEPQVAGNVVSFTGLAPEALVTVTNQAGDRLQFPVAEGPLTLTDPGTYFIDVASPFPRFPVVGFRVEVPNG